MDNLPKCYGTYGSAECGSCKWAEWCVNSADPPSLDANYRFREYAQNFEGFDAIEHKQTGESSKLAQILGELLVELETDRADLLWDFLASMSALSKEYPGTYRVVRMRIMHPQETYDALGKRLGMTRQCVENHLRLSVEMIPEIRAAMPYPRARLNREADAFSVRCGGGSICILATGVSIVLRMPMDEKNSKSALKIARGLNNLHWRKRDALLDDLK